MSVSAAFTPLGNTVVLTAATSAPTAVQVNSNSAFGGNQYRIINAKDAKASALAKLTALGLTQAEVTALIG